MWPASEQSKVAVDAARAHVVIAGSEMTIAPDAIDFLSHYQANFTVRFVAQQAVNYMRSHLFERARPGDIRLFLGARRPLPPTPHHPPPSPPPPPRRAAT